MPHFFLGPVGDFFNLILNPLYYAVSAVMLAWHWLFTQIGLDPEGGAAWALSIIGLTLVIRACLIPLFVKQIKASRNMQLIQPKVKELQKKYGHDRERLAQETMKLYKDSGTNPFASCLPILLQMPIFFALFRLIDEAGGRTRPRRPERRACPGLRPGRAVRPASASPASFTTPLGSTGVQILAAVLVLAMTATTFLTQRQLMAKNMPPDALTGPYAQQQKMLLYVLPVVFAVGGIAFPDRRAPLLDHLQPVDDGPAVLRDPQQPGTRHRGRPDEGKSGTPGRPRERPRRATVVPPTPRRGRRRRSRRSRSLTGGPPQRQQPQRQSKRQRQAKARGGPSSGASPAGNQRSQNDKTERKQAVSEQTDERQEVEESLDADLVPDPEAADEAEEADEVADTE